MDIECLAGMFWNQNVYTCFPCPADTYNSVPGRNTWCEPCTEVCVQFEYVYIYQMLSLPHSAYP